MPLQHSLPSATVHLDAYEKDMLCWLPAFCQAKRIPFSHLKTRNIAPGFHTVKNIQPIMISEALPFFWWQVIILPNLAFLTKLVLQTAWHGSENPPEDKHLQSLLASTSGTSHVILHLSPQPTANIPHQSILDLPRDRKNEDSLLHLCFLSLTRRGHYRFHFKSANSFMPLSSFQVARVCTAQKSAAIASK